jgi:hypothetical protein
MLLAGFLSLVVVMSASAREYHLRVGDVQGMFDAMELVENPAGNPNAIGDRHMRHKAYGLLQIRYPYLKDVNRIARKEIMAKWGRLLTMQDIKDQSTARWAATVYMSHYGARYERLTGLAATMEVYARIHNGGPNGWKHGNHDTAEYWAKVRSAYKIVQSYAEVSVAQDVILLVDAGDEDVVNPRLPDEVMFNPKKEG